jgi:uncharacterized protein involved in exopolysaccharide biosynthesis
MEVDERTNKTGPQPRADEGVSFVRLITVVLRHLPLIAGTALVLGALGVTAAAFREEVWGASSTFHPVQAEAGSRLSGLAAQFGLDVGGQSNFESLTFYAKLIRSRDLMREVAQDTFTSTVGGRTVTVPLAQLLRPETPPDDRVTETMRWLVDNVSAGVDRDAGLITLHTRAPDAELAIALNERVLQRVNQFNLVRRQSRASVERQFVEARFEEAERELRAAERGLEQFLIHNRAYSTPQLRFEEGRLQQEVTLREQIYASLAQNYEQARIDEVRNTPVITVVEHPAGSAQQEGVGMKRALILASLAGAVIGFMIAILSEIIAETRRRDPQAFSALQEQLRGRLRPFSSGRSRTAAAGATPAGSGTRGTRGTRVSTAAD